MASEYVENVAKLCDVRILKSLKPAKCCLLHSLVHWRPLRSAVCSANVATSLCDAWGRLLLFVEVLQVIALFKYVTFPTDRDVDNAPPVALILLPRKFVVALVILDVGKVPLLVRKIP